MNKKFEQCMMQSKAKLFDEHIKNNFQFINCVASISACMYL